MLLQEQGRQQSHPRERQQPPGYPPPGMGPGPMSPSAMGNFMQQMMSGGRGGMPPPTGRLPMGRPGPGPAGPMGRPRGQYPPGFSGAGAPASTLDMVWSLDLSEEQRQEMMDLSEQLRREKWDLLGKVMDHNADIRRLKAEEVRHRKAIAELGKKIEAVTNNADERAADLLTEDQREQLEEIRQQMSSRSGRRPGY